MASLSILIPAYNWDCTDLVTELHRQATEIGLPFEILLADDGSTNSQTRESNNKLNSLQHCSVINLTSNLGRAAIRNLLADNSVFETLLFMDCDALLTNPDFLKEYMKYTLKADIVCGGLVHPETLPRPGVELRYKYEKRADKTRSAKYRSIAPYSRFTPFSFLINRYAFMKLRFHEEFRKYGYEDVLFGIEARQKDISILHIDNPLTHIGLEDNKTFLAKTREAMESLYEHRIVLESEAQILHTYRKMERLRLRWTVRGVWKVAHQMILSNLNGHKPLLWLFSFYKLAIYTEYAKNNKI